MNKLLMNGVTSAMMSLGFCSGAVQAYSSGYSNRGYLPDKQAYLSKRERDAYSLQSFNADAMTQKINAESQLSLKQGNLQEVASNTFVHSDAALQLKKRMPVTELIIIDQAVPDKHIFYKNLKPSLDIVEVSSDQDGLAQLKSILSRYQNLDSLHVISHANDGQLMLGSGVITESSLRQDIAAISIIDRAMKTDADILFYGCNLAKSNVGESFLELIAENAHVDVAASSNYTGAASKQGDWDLEIATGDINSKLPFTLSALENFSDVLGSYTPRQFCNDSNGGKYQMGLSTITSSDGNYTVTSSPSPFNCGYNGNLGYRAGDHTLHLTANGADFELSALALGGGCTTVDVYGFNNNTQVASSTGNTTASFNNFVDMTNFSEVILDKVDISITGCSGQMGLSSFTVPQPEMNIRGNNQSISDGDVTPSSSDYTDFGTHSVGDANLVRTFTVQNTGLSSLDLTGVPNVAISGSADFFVSTQPVSSSIAVSSSTTFQITFDPTTIGTQSATVSIANNDADENPYNFSITANNVLLDSDGDVIASAIVTEPVNLGYVADTAAEAMDLFDFTFVDGGGADGLAMDISSVVLNVTGTASDADRAKVTWRLNGSDASNVVGIYNAGADTITFSGLSVSIANGASETYTVNGYFNDNSGLTNGHTIILSVDGDTDITVSNGTRMGTTSVVTNSTGLVITDDQAPIVSSVSVPANATYIRGQILDFIVNFDDTVSVNTTSGTPRIPITVGGDTRYAHYILGNGTSALTFRYTVQNGDVDSDGIVLGSAIDTNSGTLNDSAGNNIETTLNNTGSLASVLVDGTVSPIDTDGDGVSDAQENIDGTDRNDPQDYFDETPPTFVAPEDIIVDATGLFTPVTQAKLLSTDESKTPAQLQALLTVTDNVDGIGCCNVTVPALRNGKVLLPPGLNSVTWRAVDKKGNVTQVTQKVHIRPLVSMSKDQVTVEGAQATIRIILNGQAPAYPFSVPYMVDGASTASGSDHDLTAGIATFNAGETVVTISLNIATDSLTEGDEILTVALDDRTTASQDLAAGFSADIYDINSGVNTKHNLTIVEGNVPPVVRLQVEQGGLKTNQITRAGGMVTVTAIATDLNVGDSVSLDWSASNNQLVDTDGNLVDPTLVFDPSNLNEGRYSVVTMATDFQGENDTATINFVLVAALPSLNSGVDTDGDGTNDDVEGTADTDDDGIPDYLDNIAASNVLPEKAVQTNSFLMESDPGLRLRLGIFSAVGESGGASLSGEDIEAQEGLISDGGYNSAGGIFDFEIHELPVPGQQVRMVMPQKAAISEGAVYRKFQNGAWMTFVDDDKNHIHSTEGDLGYCPPPGDDSWQVGLIAGYYCVQLTIEDGGPNDADGEVNSAISDPGSVSYESVSATVHSTGSGGASFGLLGMLLLLGAVKIHRFRETMLPVMIISTVLGLLLSPQESYAADWENIKSKSFIELEMFAVEGSQKRSDFADDMTTRGIDVNVTEYDVTRLGYQLSLGYTLNQYATFLVGYTDLGKVDLDFETSTTDQVLLRDALGKSHPQTGNGLSIAYRYKHNLMKDVSAFIDTGLFVWNGDVDTRNAGGNAKAGEDIDPMLALGIDYAILRKSTIGFKYRYHRMDNQYVNGFGLLYRLKF